MTRPPVKIVFLGGLGEIGRNCFCLEVDDRILVTLAVDLLTTVLDPRTRVYQDG